ncbi:Wzz/FepE/Etk N-terminal domain-containing protein [Neorhizobium galegae]|nr:Wzz/FepE/Etk N-terminal domain-containing protein [Neorhizobium galegae]
MRYEDIPFEKRIEAQLHSLTDIHFTDIIRWLRRGFLRIIAAAILGAVLALLYAAIASPRYSVSTEIIIDPSNLNLVSDDVFSANPQRDSQLLEVESKLRVLTSRNVLTKVINDLNLTQDPEFNRPGRLDGLRSLISSPSAPENKQLSVLRQLEKQISATRDDGSFVVVLSVWTGDAEKSIKLSNAIVSAFEGELFKSSSDSAGQLAIGLNSRLDELRRSVTEAEEKVEQFKRQNGLQSTAGELTSTRISGALDTQVLDAQQRLIQADTRYKQLQAAYADRRVANSAVFDSASMVTLRASYSALQQQISSMTLVYGSRHPRLVALQSEPLPSTARSPRKPPAFSSPPKPMSIRPTAPFRNCAASPTLRDRPCLPKTMRRCACANWSGTPDPRQPFTKPICRGRTRSASASRSTPAMSG